MAVNARDFSAAFFHISSLKNANTAASKQPNSFWFWEKYHSFFTCFQFIGCILACEGSKEHECVRKMKQHRYDLQQAQYEIFAKNRFSSESHFKILYFGLGRS